VKSKGSETYSNSPRTKNYCGAKQNEKTIIYLVDQYNHTGYAQVLEELVFNKANPDPSTETPDSTTTYTIGDDVIAQNVAGTSKYLLYDGHGSTRQLADSTGTVAENYSYDGYGVMLGGNPGSASNPSDPSTHLLYAGEQFDTSLQMYYNRARYYDQNNGRFNRMDPYAGNTQDPQSLHKYLYVHCNPINNIDPSGMIDWNIGSVITAVGIGMLVTGIIIATIGHITGNEKVSGLGWDIAIWGLITTGAGAVWWANALKGAHATVVALCAITMGLIATKAKFGFEDFIEQDHWGAKNQVKSLFYASDGKIPTHGVVLIREEVVGRELRWAISQWNEMPVQYRNGDKILEYWIDSATSKTIKVRQALVVDASSNPPVFDEILAPTEIGSRDVSGAEIFKGDRWSVIELTEGGYMP